MNFKTVIRVTRRGFIRAEKKIEITRLKLTDTRVTKIDSPPNNPKPVLKQPQKHSKAPKIAPQRLKIAQKRQKTPLKPLKMWLKPPK
jgi:hypothetical protein